MTASAPKVLVIDDEPPIRKLLKMGLTAQGYQILEAPNGSEALSVCELYQNRIHLIISDVIMPGMSGAVLRDLETSGALDRVKAIVCEAHEWPGESGALEELVALLDRHSFQTRVLGDDTPAPGFRTRLVYATSLADQEESVATQRA